MTVSDADRDLVARAREAVAARHDPVHHRSAAALRTMDGAVHLGLHLDATISAASVHGEAVALGRALADGAAGVDALAVVAHPKNEDQSFLPVPPCGECREMLVSHAPAARAVYAPDATEPGELVARPVRELLPDPAFPRSFEK